MPASQNFGRTVSRARRLVSLTLVSIAATMLTTRPTHAQPNPGPYLDDMSGPRVHAIVGARIVPEAGRSIEDGTVIVRDGTIEAVGQGIPIPPDARVWNASGYTIYPGLIDPYVRVSRITGVETKAAPPHEGPSDEPPVPGNGHPHPRVHPETFATDGVDLTDAQVADFRELGFTAAYLVPEDGIFRGRGALVSLRAGRSSDLALSPPRGQCIAYDVGEGKDDYPRSIMGVVALQRQTFLDTRHYLDATRIYDTYPAGLERPERSRSFDALAAAATGRETTLIEVDDVLATLRAGKLAREFGLSAVLRASGEEYVYAEEVKALGYPLILPIAFPDAPYFEDDLAAYDVSLRSLRVWNEYPSNPKVLAELGVPFALTTDRLRKTSLLPRMVRAAIDRGLSADQVLRSFTIEAARIHGAEDRVGTIEKGKVANLTVTDGELFALGTTVRQVWVDGTPHLLEEKESQQATPFGSWRIELAGSSWLSTPDEVDSPLHGSWLVVEGEADSLVVTWIPGSGDVVTSGRGQGLAASEVAIAHTGTDTLDVTWNENGWGLHRLFFRDSYLPTRVGFAELNGEQIEIRAERRHGAEPSEKEREKESRPPLVKAPFAPGPIESPSEVLVRNATIWTCGPDGILESGDLLVRNGKIVQVGQGLVAGPAAKVIDAAGLQVTPGLMDCHSHSMVVGDVNEWTLASSAMVGIEDVVDSRTPTIYRHLAGGLTLASQLHGSANPIGGKNAVVKMRWGQTPDGLLVRGAPPGIKFALGENVTQTSWGEAYTTRYPKSRMGVEQWVRDRFLTAATYAEEWKAYGSLSPSKRTRTIPPRRDLELDTLVQILNGERYVHCHSYRQDEILMLMRLAESLGFRIRTFQHILEGYKVAPEMAAHGVMGSTFSDWWAFKPEVYDAIPYNAALMTEAGVNVTMNSDSAELARRMNLEGAKAVKWGGVDREEALKMITLNTAIQLGLDRQMGSLEPGKDADFVLWSGDPLSTGSICLETWIEGKLYFDRDTDIARRAETEEQRQKLLALAREFGATGGDEGQGPPTMTSYDISETEQYTCGHDHGDGSDAHSGSVGISESNSGWKGGAR
ncbi:MAG: amidohydrolase family protein [Candidatus Eisenbacteria bacterium]